MSWTFLPPQAWKPYRTTNLGRDGNVRKSVQALSALQSIRLSAASASPGVPSLASNCYHAQVNPSGLESSSTSMATTVDTTRNLILSLFPASEQSNRSLQELADK